MKQLLLLFLAIIFLPSVYSQTLENPSFEEWEKENGKAEPVNWSSIQTSIPSQIAAVAPQTMKQSEDSHTGKYSIKLENLSTFGIVATGTITNGRFYANLNPEKGYAFTNPDDPRWNTPLSVRPDSIAVWYKFTPPISGVDFPTVKVLLHLDSAKIPDPDSTNYVAFVYGELPSSPQTTWKRVSFPFKYRTSEIPDYILIILTSGNGTEAVAGSVAYFDDIELIYNTTITEEIEQIEPIEVLGLNKRIRINMNSAGLSTQFNIKIYNIIGWEAYSGTISQNKTITIDNLHAGVYICIFTGRDGRNIIKKIIVE